MQAEAAIEKAQLNYNWCTVNAPIAGRIDRHFVDVGNLVSQDVTSLTNIVSIKPIWAYFDVDQNTALDVEKLIAEGKMKRVRDTTVNVGMSLGQENGFPIAGTIDFVSNQLDPNTGSLRVRAVFPNEDGFIGAGMFGRVRVPIGQPHDALLVLDEAIGTNQGQKYVLRGQRPERGGISGGRRRPGAGRPARGASVSHDHVARPQRRRHDEAGGSAQADRTAIIVAGLAACASRGESQPAAGRHADAARPARRPARPTARRNETH